MEKVIKHKKKIIGIGLALMAIGVVVTVAYAKYVENMKVQMANYLKDSEGNEIVADFYVDITKDDAGAVINNIGIDELNPGDEKYVTFYVRSAEILAEGEKASETNIKFYISLLHTQNLPVTYELYEGTKDEIEGVEGKTPVFSKEDDTSTDESINSTKKIMFAPNESETNFSLDMYSEVEDEIVYVNPDGKHIVQKPFTLKVSWPGDKNDTSYINEVDLVYLVVDAEQKY